MPTHSECDLASNHRMLTNRYLKLENNFVRLNLSNLLTFVIIVQYCMPIYTTVQNVLDLYPRVGSLSSITSASVAFYIDQAENEINGYLINNYSMPFSATPPLIQSLSTEYGLVKLLERFFTQETGSDNAWVSARREYVQNQLTMINSGDLGLYTSSLELIAYNPDDAPFSNTMDYNPAFNMLNSTHQQLDGDRLEDEYDDIDRDSYKPDLE
jgi:phage gp36-like protein